MVYQLAIAQRRERPRRAISALRSHVLTFRAHTANPLVSASRRIGDAPIFAPITMGVYVLATLEQASEQPQLVRSRAHCRNQTLGTRLFIECPRHTRPLFARRIAPVAFGRFADHDRWRWTAPNMGEHSEAPIEPSIKERVFGQLFHSLPPVPAVPAGLVLLAGVSAVVVVA